MSLNKTAFRFIYDEMRIDSHQHFWHYDPIEHNWMTDTMGTVKRDFLPDDIVHLLKEDNIDGTVLVQVTQTREETDSLLRIAGQCDFIKGVAGWVDLSSEDILRQLAEYRTSEKLKALDIFCRPRNRNSCCNRILSTALVH